jgi:alanine racemase
MIPSARGQRDEGAKVFFAARLDDALAVRAALGAGPQVSVLDGVGAERVREAWEAGLAPVLNTPEQVEAWLAEGRRRGQKPEAFVHIDTGMNRLGLSEAELARVAPLLAEIRVAAYMTHFAAADDVDIAACRRQAEGLRRAVAGLPPAPLSIANSCGVFLGAEFHGDLIRPGKSTFGINPLPVGKSPVEQPAMVLAPVVQVRDLAKGDPVGYSFTWRAPEPRRVAILAIGYSNGFLRSGSGRGTVAFAGRTAPVVGRVSMDLTAVDVTHLPEGLAAPGALAEILGPTISYTSLAAASGTNEHEALIALGRGCPRVFTGSYDQGLAAVA